MKKLIHLVCTLLIGTSLVAQNTSTNSENPKEKKIETIKIIDGDTVFHDIRTVNDADRKRNLHKMRIHRMHSDTDENLSEEIDNILEDVDVYINVDDAKKKMIIHKMQMNDDEFESIVQSLEEDEDLIIDMKNGRKAVKVIKIEIDEEDGEEIKVIEIKQGYRESKNEGQQRRNRKKDGSVQSSSPHGLKIFPNPAKDELNLSFNVNEGSETEVTIVNTEGKQLFNRKYRVAGIQHEKISLDEKEKGIYIVNLKDEKRTISKKIIIE